MEVVLFNSLTIFFSLVVTIGGRRVRGSLPFVSREESRCFLCHYGGPSSNKITRCEALCDVKMSFHNVRL